MRSTRHARRWLTSSSPSYATSGRPFAVNASASASERVTRRPRGEGVAPGVFAGAAVLAILVLVLFPSPAFAWTPGTHVLLGEAVLRSLALLPGPIAELLAAFPYDFLYGSIAADTSIAKKYAAAGRDRKSVV